LIQQITDIIKEEILGYINLFDGYEKNNSNKKEGICRLKFQILNLLH